MAASLGFVVANNGTTPTFQRANAESVIDITFERLGRCTRMINWKILEAYSSSNHKYITYELRAFPTQPEDTPVERHSVSLRQWAYRNLDHAALEFYLRNEPPPQVDNSTTPDQAAEALARYLTDACNSCMPLRPVLTSKRRPVHWWTAEIALLRSNCFSARRRYQRAARRVEAERATALQTEYRTLRKELRLAIRKAQEADWADMCRAVDNDPWGLPYRVVTRKIGRSPAGMEARGKEGEIAGHLFPNLSATDWTTAPSPEEPLLDSCNRLLSGKAPGPDGVHNDVLRQQQRSILKYFLTISTSASERVPNLLEKGQAVSITQGPRKTDNRPIQLPAAQHAGRNRQSA
ncbi:uncharacterized protein LOC112680107 [Sipha flava]|uniref:Uncharacterized protein LOC112680107 n=1 Tax=Sipha flava TaxID=143950 RepID=A0A8B8F5T7_9HEMI|nr:uncharacterized protein LOC112680107 [Sipha flava]